MLRVVQKYKYFSKFSYRSLETQNTCSADSKEALAKKILSIGLINAKEYGFTFEALEKASQSIENKESLKDLFPLGELELYLFARTKWLENACQVVEMASANNQSSKEKILAALNTHIDDLSKYKDHFPSMLKLSLHPSNIIDTISHFLKWNDIICMKAGDSSTNLNFYSRRFMLSLQLIFSDLCMFAEKDAELSTTKNITNRLNDIFSEIDQMITPLNDKIGKIHQESVDSLINAIKPKDKK